MIYLIVLIYMGRLKGDERKVVKYFNEKKYYNGGFLRYSFWYNRIRYCLGDCYTKYEIRKIFVDLVEKKYFLSQKTKVRSYTYQFRNKKIQEKLNEPFDGITIVFE